MAKPKAPATKNVKTPVSPPVPPLTTVVLAPPIALPAPTQEMFDLLTQWTDAAAALEMAKKITTHEMTLRLQVMDAFFPSHVEGAAKHELPHGWVLKGTAKLNREIDETALPAILETMREAGFKTDALIEMKPVLQLKVYRELAAISLTAIAIFDEALTIKPAAPTLELVAPKVA